MKRERSSYFCSVASICTLSIHISTMQHLSSSLNHRARALYLCIISSFPSRCSIDPRRNPLTKREGGCHFWHPKPKTHIFPQHHDLPLPRCAITLHSQLFRFWPRPRPPTSFGSFLMDDRKREGSINGAKVCINKGRKKGGRGGVLLLLSLHKGFGGCSQPLRSMHSSKAHHNYLSSCVLHVHLSLMAKSD